MTETAAANKQRRPSKTRRKRSTGSGSKRPWVSQSEFPRFSLDQALRIPQALWDEFAGKDAPPHDVAIAIKLAPTSGNWRLLCGATTAYGLTDGGYNATRIALTDLGRRVVAPIDDADRASALVEAALQPRLMQSFLKKYDRAKFPSDMTAVNFFTQRGLRRDRAEAAVEILKKNGEAAGIFRETKTGIFVALDSPHSQPAARSDAESLVDGGASGQAAPPAAASDPAVFPRPVPAREADSGSSLPLVPQQPLRRGTVIDVYKLRQRLGSGFSAEVWSATVQKVPPGVELKKGDAVALKFYQPQAMALRDQVLRVEREYRIAQTIRHPHLIRIYEFLLAAPRPHHNFLVMGLAKGKPLSSLIASAELAPSQTLVIIHQILSALDELHGHGALHRDVKPSNISVAMDGGHPHAVLLDLGIVTVTYEKGLTAMSHFVGSKHWAPLEQLLGKALDERSDLYGVAAVAYNALVGVEPYATSGTEAAVAVDMTQKPLIIPAREDVPADVRDMLNACLSPDVANRPNSARDCLDVLQRHIRSKPEQAPSKTP